jgi:SAM-dependent methyltransferase
MNTSRPKNLEYLLDSGSDLGREQLDCLQILLDAHTTACLDAVGVRPGQRCLDLGAGGGSITRRLAERAGPTGRVVAVDISTDHLVTPRGVEVCCHDINDGLPVEGPFDLIHARLVLMHLSRREEILRMLAAALAPGGWLVIGEFTGPQQRVESASCAADEHLFLRVQEVAHAFLAREHGISYDWAYEVDRQMAAAGLMNIDSRSFSQTTTGGDIGCLLSRNYVVQIEDVLLGGSGITAEELDRYRKLLMDPRFRAWFYTFVCTRGQRPPQR